MIEFRNVSKTYDKADNETIHNASFKIEKGEFVFLVGSSGSGKSTLIKLIEKEEDPTSGQIIINGKDTTNLKQSRIPYLRRSMGVVFQDFRLLPDLTVYENVAFAMNVVKAAPKHIRRQVPLVLAQVGLSKEANKYPDELSGGQQQRVALARALVIEPSVLLFDEPLSNLDAKLRVVMRTEIRKIQQRVGITAIYVTHDQSEAMALSDRIIIMEKGVVAQIGTPEEIYYHPVSKFVADFIGEANFLRGKVDKVEEGKITFDVNGTEFIQHTHFPVAVGEIRTLVLRPESITLEDEGKIPCEVILSNFMGAYHYYQVKVGESIIKIQVFNPKNKKTYKEGDKCFMAFSSNNIHILGETAKRW